LAFAASTLICLWLFIVRERAVREPFLDVRIFASHRFSAALGAFLLVNVIFMGILYLLPFYLATVMQYDSIAVSLCLLVPPAVIAIISIPFGRWSDRAGRRVFILAACIITFIYSAIFAIISPGADIALLLTTLFLMGASFGIASAPASGRIVETAPRGMESTASSLLMTVIYFGGVLGTAIYAAIFTMATMDAGTVVDFAWLTKPALLSGFHVTAAAGLLLCILAIVLAAAVGDPVTEG
jgi:MFS family permease